MQHATKVYCIVQETMGFPGGSDGKDTACNIGDVGLNLGFKATSTFTQGTIFNIL